MIPPPSARVAASFRDPAGHMYMKDGVLYRQVNLCYQDDYITLMDSGLYNALVSNNLLIPHEVFPDPCKSGEAYCVLRPEPIPFISYPYEWAFSALRDAALLTLEVQQTALRHGMTLKDATAYNIQFHHGRPVLIDTLSFERLKPGRPWVAYRQFCQHFLAPLALMAQVDIRLQRLLESHLDGIPLDLASGLLPKPTWFSPGTLFHLHLHARSQKRYEGKRVDMAGLKVSPHAQEALLDSLKSFILGLRWQPDGTTWANYYSDTNYSDIGLQAKASLVGRYLDDIQPSMVWDLGANDGRFSREASKRGIRTMAFDMDPAAVEKGYREVRRSGDPCLLPLRLDLTAPSPAIGWSNQERSSLMERGPVDAVLALALVHHLAIGNNVPFPVLARFFAQIAKNLIIEFVPPEDSQVARLLVSREGAPHPYNQDAFEQAFADYFETMGAQQVVESNRIIYHLKNRVKV